MAQVDTEAPDEVLVVAAILGDLTAFDELVTRYRPAVIRTAQTILPAQDSEDVAQEAMLLAFKALPSLEEPRKFPAWLHAITRRCAIRFSQRARSEQRSREFLDDALVEQIPAITRAAVGEEESQELMRALKGIPWDYALALRLHFYDEMPLKRIAGFLGVSLAIVKWRVHRGKQLLRMQLNGNERSEIWNEIKK